VAEHRAELGFTGDPGGVGEVRDLAGHLDILVEGEPRAVDHDRAVAQGQRLRDNGPVVDALVVFVDHGHMIEVEAHLGPRPLVELGLDGSEPLPFELVPFEARGLDQPEAGAVGNRPHDGLDHREVRHIECGDHQTLLEGAPDKSRGAAHPHTRCGRAAFMLR